MTTKVQRGRLAPSHPHWVRMLAMLCVLLVGGIGTAQAAHIHGQWLPHGATRVSLATDGSQGETDDHCPLCVAMHSALPTAMQIAPEPVQSVLQRLTVRTLAAPERLWSFAMFSRPPPVAGGRTQRAGI